MDFYLDYVLPESFRLGRIWKKNNVLKILLNKNRFINSFALFSRECRSTQMKGVRIDFQLYYALPVPFRVCRIWKKNNVYKNIIK